MRAGVDRLVGVDLNLFFALHMLLEEGSVTAAADRARVSQPTMSRWLQRLREVLDDPILVRDGRGFVPTTRATDAARELAESLAGLEGVLEGRTSFDPATSRRMITLAVGDYTAGWFVPGLLDFVRQSAPGIRITVAPVIHRHDHRLSTGEVDLMLGQPGVDVLGVEREFLGRARLVGVASRDHRFVYKAPTLEEWLDAEHALVDTPLTPSAAIETILRKHGRAHHVAMRLPFHLALPLVMHDAHVVGVQNEITARTLEADGQIGVFELPFAVDPLDFELIWCEARTNDPVVVWFRAQIEAFVRIVGLEGPHGAHQVLPAG